MPTDQKVSNFIQAITAYAEAQRRAIHEDVEKYKAERLRDAEEEALRDAYALIHREQAEMRREIGREMARRDVDTRKKLLSRRRDIMAGVFSRAEESLREFTAGGDYQAWLKKSLAEMRHMLPDEGTVYYHRPEDAETVKTLDIPSGSVFSENEEIQIGGLRGLNSSAGILLDDTLDIRLELQREWFIENAGMQVG